jgi:hypothetical protein
MLLCSYISCLIFPWLSLFGEVAEHQGSILFLTLCLTSVPLQEQSVVMSGPVPCAFTFHAIEERGEESINLVFFWFFHLCPQVSQHRQVRVTNCQRSFLWPAWPWTTLALWSSGWHLDFHQAPLLYYVASFLVTKTSAELSLGLLRTLPLILLKMSYTVSV